MRVWVRVRLVACTYLGSSCRDTWHGRGHPWTVEGRPPLTDLARLSAANPALMIILFPALTKYLATDPRERCTLWHPNWSRLLWLPRFEFREITVGRFEKSAKRAGGWNGRFISMEDLKEDVEVAYGY